VFGLESDFQISGERGSSSFADPFSSAVCSTVKASTGVRIGTLPVNGTATTTYTSKIEWFGTVRGRVALLFGDQILVYGTGGLAYGRVQTSGASAFSGLSFFCSSTSCPAPFAFNGSAFSAAKTNVGFSAGAGMEGKLGFLPSNWTWKLEYLYVDLGSLDAVSSFNATIAAPFGTAVASATTTLHTHFTDNIVRVGLNYQFH
jgi:outer membrane immunogenic protein